MSAGMATLIAVSLSMTTKVETSRTLMTSLHAAQSSRIDGGASIAGTSGGRSSLMVSVVMMPALRSVRRSANWGRTA